MEDETGLDIDICVITVEVKSLLVAIEECVNNAVSDMIVEVSKIDVIKVEL
jgi:hypothetical protein